MSDNFSPPLLKPAAQANQNTAPTSPVLRQPAPRQPPVFHSHDDFENLDFQVSVYLATVPNDRRNPFLLSFLGKDAATVVRNAGISVETPADEIRSLLRKLFARAEPPAVWREPLLSKKQQRSESVDEFLWAIMDLAAKAYPGSSNGDREGVALERFCMGLLDEKLRNKFLYWMKL